MYVLEGVETALRGKPCVEKPELLEEHICLGVRGGVSAVTLLCRLLVPSEDTAVTSYTARSLLCSSE